MIALLMSAAVATSAYQITDTIKVGGTGGWDYATFDPTTRKMYIAHGMVISAVDVDAKTANAALAPANGAHIALPFNDGKTLMVTNGKANAVTLNDATSGAVLATIATDTGPDGATIDPSTGHGFVMANHGGMVDVIDLQGKTVLGKIAVPGKPEGAAADGMGRVFTHLEDKNALVVIDAKAMKVTATYDMKGCDSPSGMAYVGGAHDWILSACDNKIARITDAKTGKAIASLPIGDSPDFALYDADRKVGYVPAGEGVLTVIDFSGAQPVVLASVATQKGARTAALDAKTGNVLLPTADFAAPEPGAKRPSVVAETFRVLIVGPK
jgi:DNA-binding beta-propeller fold protein YncE